jgi:LacI family transcriptional regulator
MDNGAKASGIKDIAKALGVSIGTVDRAIHGRSGVSEKTKAKVLRTAERLGYKPNLAAQALKLNRQLSIAVILPRHISAKTYIPLFRSSTRGHPGCCRGYGRHAHSHGIL